MNEPGTQHKDLRELSREETHSIHFVQLILQLSNMAMMLMGKMPDPQTGQTLRDLEAARLFIDQLEALEAKTQGNRTKEEDTLLKQTLMALRLSFVEAVDSPEPAAKTAESGTTPGPTPTSPATPENPSAPTQSTAAATDESSAKRFSKKYSS